jgi:hypothetical protein
MNSAVPDSSETNFYDAIVSTSEAMKMVTGRKALIVITSGVDTFSKAKYDDVLNTVRASGTPVYIINLGPDLREAAKGYANAGPYAHLDWRKIERTSVPARHRSLPRTDGLYRRLRAAGLEERSAGRVVRDRPQLADVRHNHFMAQFLQLFADPDRIRPSLHRYACPGHIRNHFSIAPSVSFGSGRDRLLRRSR